MVSLLCLTLIIQFVCATADDFEEADRHWWVAIIILTTGICFCSIPWGCRQLCYVSLENGLRPTKRGLAKVAQLARYRIAVSQSHSNEVPQHMPPSGRYLGQLRESDDHCFIDYDLKFLGDGKIKGSVRNRQKTFVVDGFYHADKGKYIWGETDNSLQPALEHSPLEFERKLISTRACHTEAEVTVKDAISGHLFINFIASTGLHGNFHCSYSPIGHLPSSSHS